MNCEYCCWRFNTCSWTLIPNVMKIREMVNLLSGFFFPFSPPPFCITVLSKYWPCSYVQSTLGTHEGLVSWTPIDTKIEGCSINLSEKAMAPHSSTLAWKMPWMEEPGRLQSRGRWGSDTTEQLHFHFSLSCIGEGNGNPLQCSCLENPRDGGALWAAIYGVAQSDKTEVT